MQKHKKMTGQNSLKTNHLNRVVKTTMFAVNEYFEGKVKSLAFHVGDDDATVGVMAAGEYEFGTGTIEHMTLISGKMSVMLPGKAQWQPITVNETFTVEANVNFKVKIDEESAYLCVYKK